MTLFVIVTYCFPLRLMLSLAFLGSAMPSAIDFTSNLMQPNLTWKGASRTQGFVPPSACEGRTVKGYVPSAVALWPDTDMSVLGLGECSALSGLRIVLAASVGSSLISTARSTPRRQTPG